VAIRRRNETGSGLIANTKALFEYCLNTSIHLSDLPFVARSWAQLS
jgi:hypothetical protein